MAQPVFPSLGLTPDVPAILAWPGRNRRSDGVSVRHPGGGGLRSDRREASSGGVLCCDLQGYFKVEKHQARGEKSGKASKGVTPEYTTQNSKKSTQE